MTGRVDSVETARPGVTADWPVTGTDVDNALERLLRGEELGLRNYQALEEAAAWLDRAAGHRDQAEKLCRLACANGEPLAWREDIRELGGLFGGAGRDWELATVDPSDVL